MTNELQKKFTYQKKKLKKLFKLTRAHRFSHNILLWRNVEYTNGFLLKLTKAGVISIRNLRLRLISIFMILFYNVTLLPFTNCPMAVDKI